jgi:hypothetical protein
MEIDRAIEKFILEVTKDPELVNVPTEQLADEIYAGIQSHVQYRNVRLYLEQLRRMEAQS